MDITALKASLGDELYAQVAEKLNGVEGLSIIQTNDGSWLPKSRLDDEIGKHKATKSALAELTKQLEAAKQAGEGTAALQAEVDSLKQQVAEKDAAINGMKRSSKIQAVLAKANARDTSVLEALLDQSKIGENDKGELTGIDEQIKALKESKAFLFTEEPGSRGGFGGGKNPPDGGEHNGNAGINAIIRNAAGYSV